MSHFTERWHERGIRHVNGEELAARLVREFSLPDHGSLERVMPGKPRDGEPTVFMRFFVDDVPFYALFTESGILLTVYDQSAMRKARRSRKFRNKHRSTCRGWKRLKSRRA